MVTEFPAVQYEQGGRTVYAAATRIGDILAVIPDRDDPTVISDANRRLYPSHAHEYGEYLWDTPDWVTGPLMVGVSAGAFRDARATSGYGTVSIPPNAAVHLFDGQHRVEGIRWIIKRERDAIDALDAAGVQDAAATAKAERIRDILNAVVPTIFYVEDDVAKLQQMYSDLSRVRPPDPITTARFDTRDPFNVAARALAESHPLLKERVDLERNALSRTSDSLLTLNQLAALLAVLWTGKTRRRAAAPEGAPEDVTIRGTLFFNTLVGAFPVFRAIVDDKDSVAAARERGEMVVSVTMLKVLASAWRELGVIKQHTAQELVRYLSTIPSAAVQGSVWEQAGIPAGAKAPIGRAQVDAAQQALIEGFEQERAA
jgi:DGQHR domain-containing protein